MTFQLRKLVNYTRELDELETHNCSCPLDNFFAKIPQENGSYVGDNDVIPFVMQSITHLRDKLSCQRDMKL